MEYNDILSLAQKCGSDHLSQFGGEFEGGYKIQQNPDEIAKCLFDLQRLENINYLEIGVAAGGLTRLVSDVLSVNNVVLVDLGIHPAIPEYYEENMRNLKNKGLLCRFHGDSHSELCKEFLWGLNMKFDLVFVDGDHEYGGVKQDFELIQPFVHENTFICCHDIKNIPGQDVARFFEEIRGNYHDVRTYDQGTRKGIGMLKGKK